MAKKKFSAREIPELTINLLPLMDQFCAMIPFLLTATAFYQLSVVNLTLVTNSPAAPSSVADQNVITLDLFLSVKAEGYVLTASKPLLDNKSRIELPKLPDGRYDLEGLHDAVMKIKQTYADANTLFLTVGAGVDYNTIILTLDRCRDYKAQDGQGKDIRIPLFTKVSLAKET